MEDINHSSTKDIRLSFSRVGAMFLIIVTHLIAQIELISSLSLVTNSAIYTFLFISGYLYGKKDIQEPAIWFIKRMKKLLIPVYVYLLFIFSYSLIYGNFEIEDLITHVFNLQGFLGGVQGTGHLWFVSTIMICYLITPILNKSKNLVLNLSKLRKLLLILTLITLWIVVSLSFDHVVGNNLGYLLFYSMAYNLSRIWKRSVSVPQFIILTILTIVAFGVRLIARSYIDGSNLYDVIIVTICQSISGFYIFVALDNMKVLFTNEWIVKTIEHFDGITYEMYIVHYCFIIGPFFIWGLTNNILIDSLLVIIATYTFGLALSKLSNKIKGIM